MSHSVQKRFESLVESLGLVLPPAPAPAGVYKPCVTVGNLLYVSGHGPLLPDGTLMVGRVGRDLDADQGKAAARQVGLTSLATLLANLDGLDRVRRVVKVLGMVYATDDFARHPYVINGCSELFAEIWGADAARRAAAADLLTVARRWGILFSPMERRGL